jgi:hypothetical protein
VIVVRQDGKDLTPYQAEALAYYCQFKLRPVFEDSLGTGYVKRTREEVVSQFLTRAKFEKFWRCLGRSKPKLVRMYLKSPYDV